MYVVTRTYGPNTDYLCGWDPRWGTVASLSLTRALRYATRDEAQVACSLAACLVNGMTWRVATV